MDTICFVILNSLCFGLGYMDQPITNDPNELVGFNSSFDSLFVSTANSTVSFRSSVVSARFDHHANKIRLNAIHFAIFGMDIIKVSNVSTLNFENHAEEIEEVFQNCSFQTCEEIRNIDV